MPKHPGTVRTYNGRDQTHANGFLSGNPKKENIKPMVSFWESYQNPNQPNPPNSPPQPPLPFRTGALRRRSSRTKSGPSWRRRRTRGPARGCALVRSVGQTLRNPSASLDGKPRVKTPWVHWKGKSQKLAQTVSLDGHTGQNALGGKPQTVIEKGGGQQTVSLGGNAGQNALVKTPNSH